MSQDKSFDLIKNIYLFKEMPTESIRLINEICRIETYQKGDPIFSQGDAATAMYFIKYGSVGVYKRTNSGDKIEVAVLGTGSHFGEMSFLDREPRSASAESMEKSEIGILEYDLLKDLFTKNSQMALDFYRSLAHFLGGRLRITTNDLSFSREINLKHF